MNYKRTKQLMYCLLLAVIMSIGLIIHGAFFDLDFSQIERLTVGGFLLTFFFVILFLWIIEKIFDINNQEQTQKLERRIKKLEKKK